jgi:hypothetical protein
MSLAYFPAKLFSPPPPAGLQQPPTPPPPPPPSTPSPQSRNLLEITSPAGVIASHLNAKPGPAYFPLEAPPPPPAPPSADVAKEVASAVESFLSGEFAQVST